MNEEPRSPGDDPFDIEWERLVLVCQCVGELRAGRAPEEGSVARLRALENAVQQWRSKGEIWKRLGISPLDKLACDVLMCAIAPELMPQVGFLFQQLQSSTTPQSYPTAVLLQELLGLRPREAAELLVVLSENAPLRQLGLLELEDTGPYGPIRPSRGIAARLMGAPQPLVVPSGATPIPLRVGWEDLVLPHDKLALLHEFLAWIRHRHTVVDSWGGRPVGGPIALFTGPSGTGKTLAASVIASELGWPLYRVDLGALVSKYIGETEKNINRLFAAAHGRPMVLQFDEADSLFGKRGEVKDARDRYANLEISHLLSRIELHDGPCILTTNLRGHIDAAFIRRFQVVIDFPRPDAEARARLWRLHLPPRAPGAGDIDVSFLGGTVHLTGGSIRNAALHAAYLAARHSRAIGMEEVALAVWRELGKDGRSLSPSDLGQLGSYLQEALC